MIQLETAAGSAIRNFKGAIGINVPRKRFLPVKKTSDLLVVMSNLFMINEGSLQVNIKRSISALPLVKLGDQHFQKVSCTIFTSLDSFSLLCILFICLCLFR